MIQFMHTNTHTHKYIHTYTDTNDLFIHTHTHTHTHTYSRNFRADIWREAVEKEDRKVGCIYIIIIITGQIDHGLT